MEIRDIITGCSAAFSICMALFGVGRAKRTADVAIAVDRTTQDLKIEGLERRVDGLQSELNSVKSGLEIGIGRLQDSFAEVNKTLGKMETKIAVLVDRDERPARPARRIAKATD